MLDSATSSIQSHDLSNQLEGSHRGYPHSYTPTSSAISGPHNRRYGREGGFGPSLLSPNPSKLVITVIDDDFSSTISQNSYAD